MRRREFMSVIAGAAAWPLAARAQQAAMPVIGYFAEGAKVAEPLLAAFRQGLAEAGYVEGKNIAIEYRFVIGPELMSKAARDLIRRNVNVIAVLSPVAVAAPREKEPGAPLLA